MGRYIAALFGLSGGRAPDPESTARGLELVNAPGRWSAGHAVFEEVRHRLLAPKNAEDELREWRDDFEESCCKAMYNAADPLDPFDSGTAYFWAGGPSDPPAPPVLRRRRRGAAREMLKEREVDP